MMAASKEHIAMIKTQSLLSRPVCNLWVFGVMIGFVGFFMKTL